MKGIWILLAGLTLAVVPGRVMAQAPTPAPNGAVSGRILNQNSGAAVTGSQEVMLHIWDQDNNEVNMVHGQSASDGSFLFTGVDLQPRFNYGVMAVYEGVTYRSPVMPPPAGSNRMQLDVPVYETTRDTSTLRIEQMHVVFKFSSDGIELMEIYALSNSGPRTVKDAVKLDDSKAATMRYPLPVDADYIFFQPDEADRFIKLSGGFADTSPFLPGEQGEQFAVKFLVPYAAVQAFEYVAPLDVKLINFLLPRDSGVTLKGSGLAGPQQVKLDDGREFEVYTLMAIPAGRQVQVAIGGKPAVETPKTSADWRGPLAIGGGLLGFAMVGAGIWWWRRPADETDENSGEESNSEDPTLDGLVSQIAALEAANDRGELEEDAFRRARTRLRRKAREMLDKDR